MSKGKKGKGNEAENADIYLPRGSFRFKDGSVLRNTEPFLFKSMIEFLFHRQREYLDEFLEYYNIQQHEFKMIDRHMQCSVIMLSQGDMDGLAAIGIIFLLLFLSKKIPKHEDMIN